MQLSEGGQLMLKQYGAQYNGDTPYRHIMLDAETGRYGDLVINMVGNGNMNRFNSDNTLAFWANNGGYTEDSPQLLISKNGDVGIGTLNPSRRLDVAGDINFTGNLYHNGQLWNGSRGRGFGNASLISAPANVTITTNVSEWHIGTTLENLSSINDSNKDTAGTSNYQVSPVNSEGKNIVFTFNESYGKGKFVFYNRTDCCGGRITGSKVNFKKGTKTVSSLVIPGSGNVITMSIPENIIFDSVELEFNHVERVQNFREIEIFGAIVATNPVPMVFDGLIVNYGDQNTLAQASINTNVHVDHAALTVAGGLYVGPRAELAANGKLDRFQPEYLDDFKLWVEDGIITERYSVSSVHEGKWRDLVFKADYKLPTLNQVSNYIAKNGHLKDVPSDKQVEKNGYSLVDMDATLLQKIEELMLYTIAQQKEITLLKKEMNELKSN